MAGLDNPVDPFASQEDAPPPPSAAAEAAAAAAASAAAAATSLGVSLGLSDPSLSEGKPAGIGITAMQESLGRKKRPKITHSLFFENDNGLKKILRTFPDIKVKGKGHEYEDLTLLLRHYKKWFQELHPYGDHFEDLVWKARSVLEDKEKEDDGTLSDPRERLHAFRFQYKNAPPAEDRAPATTAGAQLSDEVQARIKASREQALERKRQREAQNNAAAAPKTAAPEELDMEELWRIEEERAAAAAKSTSQTAAPPGFDDEEEDPFGFGGGGFDDDFGGPAPAATNVQVSTKAPPRPSFDDEEDVFGFGCGFDDDFAPPPPKPHTASAPGAAPEAPESKAAEAAAATTAGAANGAASGDKVAAAAATLGLVKGAFDDEDDPFAGQDDPGFDPDDEFM